METWIRWASQGIEGGIDDPAIAELTEYADVLLRDVAAAELTRELRNGHRRTGGLVWRDARLLNVDLKRTVQSEVVPEAVFEVCVDDSEWVVVDADSGESIGVEPAGPQLWTVTASWAEDRDFGPEGWAPAQREVGGLPC